MILIRLKELYLTNLKFQDAVATISLFLFLCLLFEGSVFTSQNQRLKKYIQGNSIYVYGY